MSKVSKNLEHKNNDARCKRRLFTKIKAKKVVQFTCVSWTRGRERGKRNMCSPLS